MHPKTNLLITDNPVLSYSNDSLTGNRALLQHNARHMTTTEINTQRERERIPLCSKSAGCIVCRKARFKLAIYFLCNNGDFLFPRVFVYVYIIQFLLAPQLQTGAE